VAKVLLLDGNSLTYRAFFALPTDMATASGQVTNAVFGFTSMLLNLARDQQPDGIVVAFDRPEPTFRHHMIPEYKAHREPTPDLLIQQFGLVRDVLEALRVPAVDVVGFEADDVLATIATQVADSGDQATMPYMTKPESSSGQASLQRYTHSMRRYAEIHRTISPGSPG
jgi:DNA polymerase-1